MFTIPNCVLQGDEAHGKPIGTLCRAGVHDAEQKQSAPLAGVRGSDWSIGHCLSLAEKKQTTRHRARREEGKLAQCVSLKVMGGKDVSR
jgi:hypothetical protein